MPAASRLPAPSRGSAQGVGACGPEGYGGGSVNSGSPLSGKTGWGGQSAAWILAAEQPVPYKVQGLIGKVTAKEAGSQLGPAI